MLKVNIIIKIAIEIKTSIKVKALLFCKNDKFVFIYYSKYKFYSSLPTVDKLLISGGNIEEELGDLGGISGIEIFSSSIIC